MTDTTTPLVCIHGSLRRQCEACDLADRLEACERERDDALAERDALQASNGRMSFALAEAQLAANASWRCFKCGMVLTDEAAARNHFGDENCVAELRRLSNDMLALCNAKTRALTEARRVLREVLKAHSNMGVSVDWLQAEIAAVLAQEEPS